MTALLELIPAIGNVEALARRLLAHTQRIRLVGVDHWRRDLERDRLLNPPNRETLEIDEAMLAAVENGRLEVAR